MEKSDYEKDDWSSMHILQTHTGAEIALRAGLAKGNAKGVVQFSHGAAEHAGRYQQFAEILNGAGFHFFAHDHRGHGKTRVPGLDAHQFGDDGWDLVIEDMDAVHRHIDTLFEPLPRIVMGHSMGSVAALEFTLRNPDRVDALALLGPVLAKNPLVPVLRLLLRIEALMKSPASTSGLFQSLGWDPLNKSLEPARTPYDWLSRDTAQVDAYMADPDCGWAPTVNFAGEMMRGVSATYDDARFKALKPSMPVLLMSGSNDPSTEFGKSVPELEARFIKAGVNSVMAKVFPEMRHELHNEIDRDHVFAALTEWCEQATG